MKIPTKLHRGLIHQLSLVALGALTLLVAGCGPEDWIVWAPDGQHGIARNDSRLIDPAGNALGTIAGEHEFVTSWLPDSRRVLVLREVPAQSWAEYATLLGEERTAMVVYAGGDLARLMGENRDALDAFADSPAFKIWHENLETRGVKFEAVANYLDAARPGLLDPLLEASARREVAEAKKENGSPDAGKPQRSIAEMRKDIGLPKIHELHLRNAVASGDSGDRLLLRFADECAQFVVSPHGRALAFIRVEGTDARLYATALEETAKPILIESGVEFAAWSPDGQDLAYTKCGVPHRSEKSELRLGSIARRRVCTPDGAIIAEPEAGEDIAGLILPEYPAQLAWIPDGRILFAGAKFSLPATTQNLPHALTLFALSLNPAPSIEQLIPGSVPSRLTVRANYFTVSPDGQKVAILGKAGAVSVLTLASKTFTTLQDMVPQFEKKNSDDSILVPAWRTADELTFLVGPGDPAGSSGRAEVVIASLRGEKRAISKTWPDSANLPALEK